MNSRKLIKKNVTWTKLFKLLKGYGNKKLYALNKKTDKTFCWIKENNMLTSFACFTYFFVLVWWVSISDTNAFTSKPTEYIFIVFEQILYNIYCPYTWTFLFVSTSKIWMYCSLCITMSKNTIITPSILSQKQ